MEPAPIPPHERSWRHPSELVATPTPPPPAEHTTSRRVVALATGAVAATLVVVLAVTILPRRAPAPVALSATTMPPFSVSAAAQIVDADNAAARSDQVRLERAALASPAGMELTGAPRSIAAPLLDASSVPDRTVPSDDDAAPDAIVHLITSSHVYRLDGSDLERIIAPDGTIVVGDSGRVLGSFVNGRFVAD